MDISSATSLPVQPTPQRAPEPERIEGTTPDNDSDQDDAVQTRAVEQASSTPQVTDKLGNNLNILA